MNQKQPYHQAGILFKEGEKKADVVLQASHNMMVASAKAVILGHEINPDVFPLMDTRTLWPAYSLTSGWISSTCLTR